MGNKSKQKKPMKASSPKGKTSTKRKPMSAETKAKIGTSFKTLINNDAVITVAREFHGAGWTALGISLGLVSVVLSVTPSLTQRMGVDYGNTLLDAPSYSYDVGLYNFSEKLSKEGVSLLIRNGEADVNLDDWNTKIATGNGIYYYQDKSESLNKVMFEVFLINPYLSTATDPLPETTFFTRISEGRDPATGHYRPDLMNEDSTVTYKTSYLAIGTSSIVFSRFNANGEQTGTMTGSFADIEGTDFKTIVEKKDAENNPLSGEALKEAVREEYKDIVRKSYENTKVSSTWAYVGILAAVYAGLLIIFGLLLFLLTRGKNNPFHIYTFWETQKMAYWASFAPGALALLVGYMIPNFAVMAFIFLFGMRIMWMSMKSMRPQQ